MSNKEFLEFIKKYLLKKERAELKWKLKNNYYLKINNRRGNR